MVAFRRTLVALVVLAAMLIPDTAGAQLTVHVTKGPNGVARFIPNRIPVEQDGVLDFVSSDGRAHTITFKNTDTSLPLSAGGRTSLVAFPWTSAYTFRCSVHGGSGIIGVPMEVDDASKPAASSFTFTMGTEPPPANNSFDVQVKVKGDRRWRTLVTNYNNQVAVDTPPLSPGTTIQYRARLQNDTNGIAIGYGLPIQINLE